MTEPLSAVVLKTIKPRAIEWIDKPFLQGSAFHLVAGPKGVGKGTWLARIMASVTKGTYGAALDVLLISTEDSASIDIHPRLKAAGGDAAHVHLITSAFTLPDDLDRLRELALETGKVGLIIIDPIGNHLKGADTDKEGAVRNAIHGLNALADDLHCIIVGVRHLTKARANGALASVLGSVAWVDLPRAVLAFAPDDEDDMVFHVQVVAGNRSGRGAGQAFRIELRDVGLAESVTYAAELGESSKSVDQLLTTSTLPKGAKRESIKELILRELAKGERPMDYLKSVAIAEIDACGETVWRAANELKAERKVACSNSGTGTPWTWRLRESLVEVRTSDESEPSVEVRNPETAQPSQLDLTSTYTSSVEVRERVEDRKPLTSTPSTSVEVSDRGLALAKALGTSKAEAEAEEWQTGGNDDIPF